MPAFSNTRRCFVIARRVSLDYGLAREVFLAGLGDLAARDLTEYKWGVEFYAKPFAELKIISQGAPDARNRRFQLDALFRYGRSFMQPAGCKL